MENGRTATSTWTRRKNQPDSPADDHELLPIPASSSPTPMASQSPLYPSDTDGDIENGVLTTVILKPWDRFRRKGKKNVGVFRSIYNIYTCSWLNILLVLTPVAWWAHWARSIHYGLVFALCFLSIIPHEKMFDFYGEQMKLYLGTDIGNLLTVSLNNVVEATLAILLLVKCELKLLQSTITGVVLLHLLLVPGAAFMTGGARIWEQDLHPAHTQLNHTLLTVGVLTLLLPAAFYAAVDGTATTITDQTKDDFLQISRGLAVLLLSIYIASRIFYHNPPGEGHNMLNHPNAPKELKTEEDKLAHEEPIVNQWVCLCFLAINVGIMATTAEWLVDSVEPIRENQIFTDEWFGLVLLPLVSFSADGAIAVGFFIHRSVGYIFKLREPQPPTTLAKAEAIDLSIQFLLFWAPVLVLLGWWTNKPFNLLFDFFEVATLLGACFLVNYVTADSKTNWAEGFVLLTFYVMIVLCTWFYAGETAISDILQCD
jgi:Ca2+:H+ antiporter